MPSVPKPRAKNPRRAAARRGKGHEERTASNFDGHWQIIARAMGIPEEEIGQLARRLKDPGLGYAVEAGDIDAPLRFPLSIEAKKRGELPKTLEKWLAQARRYDPNKMPVVAMADTNGSHEQRRVYMAEKDFLALWCQGWTAAFRWRRVCELALTPEEIRAAHETLNV